MLWEDKVTQYVYVCVSSMCG